MNNKKDETFDPGGTYLKIVEYFLNSIEQEQKQKLNCDENNNQDTKDTKETTNKTGMIYNEYNDRWIFLF